MPQTEVNEELSDSELENIAQKAHRKVALKGRREDYGGDYEDIEEELDEEYDDHEPEFDTRHMSANQLVEYFSNKYNETDNWDIFTDIGQELSKRGVFVKYQIRKSGRIYTHEDHPYSWQQLQEDHGEGQYCVFAKTIDGKTIEKQTQVIANLPTKAKKKEAEEDSSFGNSEGGKLNMLEYLDRKIEQARENAKNEAKERQNELLTMLQALKPDTPAPQANPVSELLPVLTQMIQSQGSPKDSGSTEILLKMQEMNMNMFKEMNSNTTKLFDKMQERNEKMLSELRSDIAMSSQKDDPNAIDQWKLLELLEDAKSKGFEQMKLINEIAEQRAEILSDKPQESLTDSVIKSLLPAMTSVMSAKGTGSYADMPNPNQPRRELSAPQSSASARPSGNPTAQASQAQHSTSGSGGAPRRQARPKNAKVVSAVDFMKVETTANEPSKTSTNTNKTESVESHQNNDKIDMNNRERILQIAIPVVVDAFNNNLGIETAVEKTIVAFNGNQINLATVPRDFRREDIEDIITTYGLAGNLPNLLREYYVKLSQRARR